MQSPITICSSAAAEAIADMEEILTEILLLVPARSLVRFKCVSKHWYTLISNPKFCHHHTVRNPNPSISAFFFPTDIESKFFHCVRLGTHGDLSGNPFKALSGLGLKVLQSSHGLFLCVPRFPEFKYGDEPTNESVYVINPTTNQFLALSSPKHMYFVRYALAFDPAASKSSHYKLVCLGLSHIHIYSSETRTWRLNQKISFSFDYQEVEYPSGGLHGTMENGVYCNGAIHWMTEHTHMLHYYDMSKECLGVAGHMSNCERRFRRYFGESSGHLYLIDIYVKTQFDVLGMGRDYSGWFVRYHVDLDLVNIRSLALHNSCLYVLNLGKEVDQQEHQESALSVLFLPRYYEILSPEQGRRRRRKQNRALEISTKGSLVLDNGYYYMETLAPVM